MHKKFKLILFLIFAFSYTISSSSETISIAYVDIDKILNETKDGQKINKKKESTIKKKNKEFKKIEESLKKQEEDIIKQKNVVSNEELEKKILKLKTEINSYRGEKTSFNNNIANQKLKATSEIVVYLNKILGKYAGDNSISLIIQKKT